MVLNQLMKIKEQSRVMIAEAKKTSELFDHAFGLAIFQEFENGEVVTWEQLKAIEIGHRLDLPTSKGGEINYSRQVNEDKNTLQYLASFSEDSILPTHKHDCVEVVYVNKGGFSVLLGNKKLKTIQVNCGDVIEIPANTPHQFINTFKGETEVKIKYIKP